MTNIVDLYQKKYSILKRRCEQLHQTNERLLVRIHQVQQMLQKYQCESRMFVEQMDKGGDDFRGLEVLPVDEVAGSCDNKDVEGSSSGTTTSSLTEQDPAVMASSSDVVTVETDTSPSLMPPATTNMAAPLDR